MGTWGLPQGGQLTAFDLLPCIWGGPGRLLSPLLLIYRYILYGQNRRLLTQVGRTSWLWSFFLQWSWQYLKVIGCCQNRGRTGCGWMPLLRFEFKADEDETRPSGEHFHLHCWSDESWKDWPKTITGRKVFLLKKTPLIFLKATIDDIDAWLFRRKDCSFPKGSCVTRLAGGQIKFPCQPWGGMVLVTSHCGSVYPAKPLASSRSQSESLQKSRSVAGVLFLQEGFIPPAGLFLSRRKTKRDNVAPATWKVDPRIINPYIWLWVKQRNLPIGKRKHEQTLFK